MKTLLKPNKNTTSRFPSKHSLSKLAFYIAPPLLSMGLAMPAFAQDGSVIGTVTDPGDNKLRGAVVIIDTLDRRTVTDADGRFRLQGVPSGEYEVTISYLGYEPLTFTVRVEDDRIVSRDARFSISGSEEVVEVIGSRAAIVSALNQERASDTLKSVVASTDAGKFPDQNIAETLQRLPGISIERSDGEGRFVSVRGLGPNFTNVKLNGARVPSTETAPDRDRAVALDVIPSELLENLEVSKVVTAEDDGDTIGGTVSISSLSAFQRDGQYISYKAELGEDARSSENSYKASLIYSNRLADDTLGVAISVSAQDRDYLIENIEAGGNDGSVEIDGFDIFQSFDTRTLDLGRERQSASINLDFRPTDNAKYHLRYTYAKLLETEKRNRTSFDFDRYDNDDFPLPDDGIVATGQLAGTGAEARVRKEFRDQDEEQEVTTISVGGENLMNNWTLDYDLSYSESTRDEDDFRVRMRNDIGGEDGLLTNQGLRFAIDDDSYVITGVTAADTADLNNPGGYRFDRYRVTLEDSVDENTEFKINLERTMDWGALKFGTKYVSHEKERDQSEDVLRETFAEADGVTLADFPAFEPDYEIGEWGPGNRIGDVLGFYQRQVDLGNLTEEGDEEDNEIERFVNDYDSEEEILAAYIMGTFDLNDTMTLIAGVRAEQTDFSTRGFIVNTGDLEDGESIATSTRFSKDYNDVLPSVNYRWDMSDEIVFRAGYYASVVRPSFARNNPTVDIDIDDNDTAGDLSDDGLSISAGNPDLDPFTADNIDLNIAWYPEAFVGVIQAGFFYKDIDNFIFRTNVSPDSGVGELLVDLADQAERVAAISDPDDIEISTVLNGDNAEVTGFELSYYQELPAGFSLGTNATFVDSEAQLEDREIPLIGQADTTANLTIGWENPKWDLRLSYAYTDDFLVRLNDEDDADNDVYTDARGQLDFGLKYRVNEKVQIYFDAINLTEQEEFDEFRENGSGLVSVYQNIEQTYLVGIRGRF